MSTDHSVSPDLLAAMAFLRKRLVGTPPNVDAEDAYMASLLDQAEEVGRAALQASPAPLPCPYCAAWHARVHQPPEVTT